MTSLLYSLQRGWHRPRPPLGRFAIRVRGKNAPPARSGRRWRERSRR
jgi:hypothetical protein